MLEIKVLGPIQGLLDGEAVDIGGPTQRRLIASLVAESGQVVSVTSLLADLWGEEPPPSGPASIHSYVSRLRRALGAHVIETVAPGYRLNGSEVHIDSVEFLEMASHLPAEPETRLETIESALAIWQGPAFEDFAHVDWAARRLTDARYELEEEKARLLASAGHTSAAAGILERITATEPLRESAWVSMGLVQAGAGDQAKAIRTLDRYRSYLGEMGLDPGPAFATAETEVFERPEPRPPRTALVRTPTSFVGRQDEAARLRALLENHRLVTIVGPGGMGKTRLAEEIATAWDDSNVLFVRLESLRDDREVAPTILHAIGGESRGDPTASVVAHLSRLGRTLLVIDNAEHVIETAAALVTEVLANTETSILTTSREALNTAGEAVLPLEPLDPASAIELYRARARSVDPGFDASSATLGILCEGLDYMPLAIEMVAARSRALGPEEILARLETGDGLLVKPRRGGTERHRSLDALVDWSYGLLEPSGQRLFERLSVIAGGFDVDLATAVAGYGDVPDRAVPGALTDLVDKSLVDRSGPGHYRMLRVLKSFAASKLESTDDGDEARTRHALWFGQLAAKIGEGLSTPEETEWIDRANAAVDDLTAAVTWSAQAGNLDSAQKILEGLFDWFYHRHPPAIVSWGEVVLPVSNGHDVHAVASAWAALAAMKSGRDDEAAQLAIAGTDVESSAGRFAWFMTGEVACYQDRLEDALEAYRKQLLRASGLNDRIGVVDAMAGETLALAFKGIFDRAVDIAVDLEQIAADIGAPTYRAYADYALGEAVIESDPERSAELLERAASLSSSVNNQFIEGMARTTLGSVLAHLGRFEQARANLHVALEMWERMGLHTYRWTTVQYLAAILAEQGAVEPAAQLLAAASKAGRRPFSAGQRHWGEVVAGLEEHPDFEKWAVAGRRLSLDEAAELATDASATHSRGSRLR